MTDPWRIICFAILTLAICMGCDGQVRESRFTQEQPHASIAGRYEAVVTLDSSTCSTAGLILDSSRVLVLIEQQGNYVTWTHTPADAGRSNGLSVRMEGALCQADEGRVELRLRGRSVVRRQLGGRFLQSRNVISRQRVWLFWRIR